MYKFLTKNGQILAFGVGLVIAVLFYVIAFNGMDSFNELTKEEQPGTTIFNFGLIAAITMTLIAFAIAIVFGIVQTASRPKAALKGIIFIVLLVAIFLISYSMADGSVKQVWADEFDVTENVSKYVSAAISTTGILAGIAVLAFIVAEVRNFFK